MSICLLAVAAGTAQAPLIRDIAAMGICVMAMDQDPDAEGFKFAQQRFVADIQDEQEIIRVARSCDVDGIICISCDAALPAVVNACSILGLPSITPEMMAMSSNKRLQRQAMTKAGLPTPQYSIVTNPDDLAAIESARSNERVVVKPADCSGSRGVSLVDADDSIDKAVREAMAWSRSGEVLIESYLEGIEYSVEAWVSHGVIHILACSEKVRTLPPYLLDREVHFPPGLPEDVLKQLEQQARFAITACGYDNTPVHVECIACDEGPVVVELAARGAGFRVFSDMLKYVSGVDIAKACVDTALGKTPDLESARDCLAASLKFIDPVPGELIQITGVEQARQVPGINDITLYPQAGDILNELRSGADRAGHIIAYAETSEECRRASDLAASKIQLLTHNSHNAAA